jgi:hypothetical protein
MRVLALAVLLTLAAFPARAALAGADFLNQIQDVRALGMGEAGQASASGVEGLTVNPAAVHDVEAQQLYFTHQILGNGIGSDNLGWGLTRGVHHVALSWLHVGYGALQGRDDLAAPTGNFSPSADAYGLTYGTTLGPVKLAATVKRVSFKIVSTAQTTSFDAGGRYKLNDDWTLGASGENLGGSLKFDSLSDPLPSRVGGGASWRASEAWTLAVDLVGPLYSAAYAAIGSEYRLRVDEATSFAFRAGINTRTPDAGRFAGLKIGLGAAFHGASLDYAFAPGADIGDEHLFALTWRFGTPDSAKGPRER